MTKAEDLANTFEEFGFELANNIVERCLDLCIAYNITDPREFVEIYVAFAINHLNGAEPTLSALDDFERKELTNYKKKSVESAKLINTQPNINDFDYFDEDGIDDDVMGAYIATPQTNQQNQSFAVNTQAQHATITNTLDSPTRISKDVSGKVVCTFGSTTLMKSIIWQNNNKQPIAIENFSDLTNSDNAGQLINDCEFMYDTMQQKCLIAGDRIYDIGQEICAKLIKDHPNNYTNELYSNLAHVDVPNQTTIKCIGRVSSDNNCQLDKHSTLLIGADEMKLRTVKLNFNRMKAFSLFPGQTVYVQGLNPRGDTLFVDEIASERQLVHANGLKLKKQLSIVIATGPFTLADDLKYQPLHELLAYCSQHKPDVLILCGPIIDADHQHVIDCSSKLSYESIFENLLSALVDAIGSDTEILIASSSRDMLSTAIFPTHPYRVKTMFRNITFLPDPSIVKINGVTVAITSTDIFSHLLEAEVAFNAGDKVKRICSYLYNQKSFYPLNPPSEKISFDSKLAQQFASLPIVPDLLVLSSSAKYFIREVCSSLVVNPGQLVENSTRGTFARLIVQPSTEQKPLNNVVGCQIIKI